MRRGTNDLDSCKPSCVLVTLVRLAEATASAGSGSSRLPAAVRPWLLNVGGCRTGRSGAPGRLAALLRNLTDAGDRTSCTNAPRSGLPASRSFHGPRKGPPDPLLPFSFATDGGSAAVAVRHRSPSTRWSPPHYGCSSASGATPPSAGARVIGGPRLPVRGVAKPIDHPRPVPGANRQRPSRPRF